MISKVYEIKTGKKTGRRTGKIFTIISIILFLFFIGCDSFNHSPIVRFDSNGGTPVSDSVVQSGRSLRQPADPDRAGFVFAGWYTTRNFDRPYNFASPVFNSFYLFARWELRDTPRVAVIDFDSKNDDPIFSKTVHLGFPVSRPSPDPLWEDYVFHGWYTVDPGNDLPGDPGYPDLAGLIPYNFSAPVNNSFTLYALYTPIALYTVTFDSLGGDPVPDQTGIKSGSLSTRPADPTYLPAFFGGWYTDTNYISSFDFNTPITSDLTLYARWYMVDPSPYNVVFDTKSGGSAPNPSPQNVFNNHTATRPADPVWTDPALNRRHNFIDWYLIDPTNNDALVPGDSGYPAFPSGTQPYDFSTPVKSDLVLYAVWEELEPFTVTFHTGTGSMGSIVITNPSLTQTITAGQAVISFYDTEVFSEPNPASFSRLYAAGSHQVTTPQPRPSQWPTAPGGTGAFVFRGWYTDNNTFQNRFDFNTPIDGNLNLYAKWLPHYMVEIAGGEFMMGSASTDWAALVSEMPQHRVIISDFVMAGITVTRELWLYVMGPGNGFMNLPDSTYWLPSQSNRSIPPNANWERETTLGQWRSDPYLPVETVSWYWALVFCNRLSILDGLEPVYIISNSSHPDDWGRIPVNTSAPWNRAYPNLNASGYRLPTEAEWEYACRAGSTFAFSNGTNFLSPLGSPGTEANYNTIPYPPSLTTPVGSFQPNPWGLFDMHGNVWEWCFDWFNEKDYYANSPLRDPQGPDSSGTSGGTRVMRVGSHRSAMSEIRSANRWRHIPPYTVDVQGRTDFQGFRIAVNIDR